MPTVIDSLVLELGLDTSKMNRDQRDAIDQLRRYQQEATRLGTQVEGTSKSAMDSLAGLKKAGLAAIAVFLGGKGIVEFTQYVAGMDAAIGRSSRTLHMGTNEISAWQSANEQAGGSAQAMTAAMHGTTDALNTFLLTGQGSFLPVLNRLGIGLRSQNGQLKTAAELYLDLASAVEKMDPARARAFLQMVPGMNEETINLLLRGRKGVEDYLEAARKSASVTEQNAASAAEFNQNLTLLERNSTSLGRTLFNFVAPALNYVAESMNNMFEKMKDPKAERFFPTLFNALNNPDIAKDMPKHKGVTFWVQRMWGEETAYKMQQATDFAYARWAGTNQEVLGNLPLDPQQALEAARAKLRIAMAQQRARSSGAPIPIKQDAGRASPQVKAALDALAGVPGINQVTSMDDDFHRRFGTGGHPLGNAFDITLDNPAQSAAMAEAIRARLKAMGIQATVLDEYRNPSGHATAGHLHVGIVPQAATGVTANSRVANGFGDQPQTNRGGDVNNTNIGNIIIHTEANDAAGIANNIGGEVRRQNLAAPMNTGQY